MPDQKIGIIGVGLMGQGIASNIQKSGWHINFLSHSGNQPTDDLLRAGATQFETAKEMAAESDVIILCVTGSPEVEDALTRDDGILNGLRTGSVVIDCSTSIPESTRKLAVRVKDVGGYFLDAPMTRTPIEAMEGRLNLIVGGDETVFKNNLSLLESFSENIAYAGGVGMGHTLKLLHNFVSLGFSSILAEAVAASNQAGVSPEVLHGVLAKGGGSGVILDRMSPYILEKDPSSFMFTLANCQKDVGYYGNMCDDLNVQKTLADALADLLSSQLNSGHAEKYVPELIDLLGPGEKT